MAFGVSGYVGLKTQSLIRVLYLPRADIAGYGFLFVKDPATSRTQSTNSCAVGLSVRFFTATIATDVRVVGKSMGNALIAGFPPPRHDRAGLAVRRRRPLPRRRLVRSRPVQPHYRPLR